MTPGDKQIVANLRHRWREELKHLSDEKLAEIYRDFSMSGDHGDNDEKFLTWIDPPEKTR